MKVTNEQLFFAMPDCSGLTEDERKEYYNVVCKELSLPASLNLLDYIWLDNADGSRKLVLYAKKGATDHLRMIHNISVIELTEKVVAECVVYTAKAKDEKTSRVDIAVGACSIRSLTGKKLGDAFAIAQTRASRRVTLQMLGCGLLDESEIKEIESEQLMQTPAGISNAVNQPAPVINNAPAAEINLYDSAVVKELKGVAAEATENLRAAVVDTLMKSIVPGSPIPLHVPHKDCLNCNVWVWESTEGFLNSDGSQHVCEVQPAASSTEEVENCNAGPEPIKQRRKRRTRAEMEAARATENSSVTPAQQAAQEALKSLPITEVEYVDPGPSKCPECRSSFGIHLMVCSKFVQTEAQKAQQALASVAVTPVVAAPPAPVVTEPHKPTVVAPAGLAAGPTEADLKEYKSKLANYQNNILTRNGGTMGPSEELGSVSNQIKLFFCKRAGIADVKDWVKQTKAQWEDTFAFMDNINANSGVARLVQIITETIHGA